MNAFDIGMLVVMLLGWIGVILAVVVPALILDARHSSSPRKHERESRAFLSARRSRD